MHVRFPKWDFSKVRAHWAPNKEFAQLHNAYSTVPAYIEPYLLKVMRIAKEKLPASETKLHEDLDIFIKQEMQHCKQHLAFNRRIAADGYEGMAEIEKDYEADYNRFLKEKSLRFNCAYSEGFEAMSAVAVTNFYEEFDEFLEGADQDSVDLWKWHLAEEFEHREVAHAVYQKLFGKTPVIGYLYRIYGFFYAAKHIRAHTSRMAEYLLSVDRKNMTDEERAASVEREAHINRVVKGRAREHLRQILSPFYNPAAREMPRGVEAYLGDYGSKKSAG